MPRRFFQTMLMAAATMLAACGRPAPHATHSARTAPFVGVLTVHAVIAPDFKTVSAIQTNRDVGDARTRIGGVLQRLLVHEGDQVRRDQLLAVIADQSLSLQAQSGAANVAAAEAAAERARADQRRYQILFDRGFLAQASLDQFNANARAAEAQLRAARAQAGALAAVSDQGRVTAPADGRVTRLPIPQGAVVLPGDVVVAISSGARVLRIEIPEADAGGLVQGQPIRILSEDDTQAPQTALVRQVYPAVDNGRVVADLDASGFGVGFVGARVRVLVPTGQRRAFIIPGRYITTRFGVDYVHLVRQGEIMDVPVQKGARSPFGNMQDSVEILSGLREGDQIVPAAAGA
ncbi:MAG: efflux RND transporter periplasmic adaptor subunit [Proteobacteria bacterium]|nr:efflux RND transporter periplasmic adaptor subunit [Pseudomonadota bacterium]